jgi:hypothetical protein
MLRFLWTASSGYRLRPWQSPYLRWRIETYSGIPAESITASAFFRFLWIERKPLNEYLMRVMRMRHTLSELLGLPPMFLD